MTASATGTWSTPHRCAEDEIHKQNAEGKQHGQIPEFAIYAYHPEQEKACGKDRDQTPIGIGRAAHPRQ